MVCCGGISASLCVIKTIYVWVKCVGTIPTGQPTVNPTGRPSGQPTGHIIQADPICYFVAATNVQSLHTQWSCTTAGSTVTHPCAAPIWSGLTCSGSTIVAIRINYIGLTGSNCIVLSCIELFCFVLYYHDFSIIIIV